MTKLKTLLLLVLAGFILVACGSDEEETVEEAGQGQEEDEGDGQGGCAPRGLYGGAKA